MTHHHIIKNLHLTKDLVSYTFKQNTSLRNCTFLVDKVPRLCAVSSQYAIDDLQLYSAWDDPEQQYKLKSNLLNEYYQFQHLPAETANGIDHSQIYYEDGAVYFRDY